MHPAFVFLAGRRLSAAELSAARIDGHLVELGDAYVPADLVEGRHTRAASVAHLVQEGAAASGPTAAWIHGARDAAPVRHHLSRAVPRRIRPVAHRRLVFHDSPVPPADVEQIDVIAVTTVERTFVDLALALHRAPALAAWLSALAVVEEGGAAAAAQRIRSLSRVPGARRAVAALDELAIRTT